MPLDEQQNFLPEAFAHPETTTNGPQLFEATFDNLSDRNTWILRAEEVADLLDIEFEWRSVPDSDWKKLEFAMMGEDYGLFFTEMQADRLVTSERTEFDDDPLNDEYAKEMAAAYREEFG